MGRLYQAWYHAKPWPKVESWSPLPRKGTNCRVITQNTPLNSNCISTDLMKIRSCVDRDPTEGHHWGKHKQDSTAVYSTWWASVCQLHHPLQDRRIIEELHNSAVFRDIFKEQKGLKHPWNQTSFTPLLWNNLVLSANCNGHELFVGSCSRG